MRAELINVPGLTGVRYEAAEDLFYISYWSGRVQPAELLAAIWAAGKKQGREFVPEVVE